MLFPAEGFAFYGAAGFFFFEYYGLELVDSRPLHEPLIRGQSCFVAALAQEFLCSPLPFNRHLGEEESFVHSSFDYEAVFADSDFCAVFFGVFDFYSLWWCEDAYFEDYVVELLGFQRRKAR